MCATAAGFRALINTVFRESAAIGKLALTVAALSRTATREYTFGTLCQLGRRFGEPTCADVESDVRRDALSRLAPCPKGEARRCYQHATGLWRPIKSSLIERMNQFYKASRGRMSADD